MLVSGFSRSDCASWVQAWGTIGALGVAIGIAWWQGKLARQAQVKQAAAEQKERAARTEYRWHVALAVVSRLRQAAHSATGLIKTVPDATARATLRATALALLDDAHRRLNEIPIFDLPDAGFADDLILLGQACCFGREGLMRVPDYEVESMNTIVESCDQILKRAAASGVRIEQDAGPGPASDGGPAKHGAPTGLTVAAAARVAK